MKYSITISLPLLFFLLSSNLFAQNLGDFHISNRIDGQFLRNDTRNFNEITRTFEEDEYTKWTLFKKANGTYQLLNKGKALGIQNWLGKNRFEMVDPLSKNAEWRIVNHNKLGVSLQHVRTGLFPIVEKYADCNWRIIFLKKQTLSNRYWTWIFLRAEKHVRLSSEASLFEDSYQVWVTDPIHWTRGRLSSKTKVINTKYEPILTKGMYGSRTYWKFVKVSAGTVRLYDMSWKQYLSIENGELVLVPNGTGTATTWELVKEGNEVVGLRNKSNQKYLGLAADESLTLLDRNTGRVFLRKADEDMTEYFFKNYCISIEKALTLSPTDAEVKASEQSTEKITLKGEGCELRRMLNENERVIWWSNGFKQISGVKLETVKTKTHYIVNIDSQKYIKIPHNGGMLQMSTDGGATYQNWKQMNKQ